MSSEMDIKAAFLLTGDSWIGGKDTQMLPGLGLQGLAGHIKGLCSVIEGVKLGQARSDLGKTTG